MWSDRHSSKMSRRRLIEFPEDCRGTSNCGSADLGWRDLGSNKVS